MDVVTTGLEPIGSVMDKGTVGVGECCCKNDTLPRRLDDAHFTAYQVGCGSFWNDDSQAA